MSDQELVNPHGKTFVGPDVRVEMAIFNARNPAGFQDVLLRFTGGAAHSAGIDGKVLRYATSPAGNGQNFEYYREGSTRVRMLSRDAWGVWEFFEVFLDGKTLNVRLDRKESEAARPLHLLTAYRQWLASAPGKLGTERAILALNDEARAAGWTSGQVAAAWPEGEISEETRWRVANVVSGLKGALASILRDEMGRAALGATRRIEIRPGNAKGIALRKAGETILIEAGAGAESEGSADGIGPRIEELL